MSAPSPRVTGPRTLWGLPATRAIGLLFVPVIIVGLLLWGLWNPSARMQTIQAAVVNLDEPVTIDGQITPLGRVLAAELIGDESQENFEWVLTDEDDAARGLASGKYITVVTIPKNFSAAATSLSKGPAEAEQAHITVNTSERAKLLDSALATAVTETATRMLNEQLGTAVISNVFVGMRSLGEGLDQVSDGADQLASGASELAGGMGTFAHGTDELADGVSQLSHGAGALATGADNLAAGTSQLATGLGAYAVGVDEFAAGAHEAAGGSHQLAAGVQQYTDGINGVLIPLRDFLVGQAPQIETIRELLQDDTLPLTPEQRAQIEALLDRLEQVPAGIDQVVVGGQNLAQGAWAQAGGLDELAAGASDLAAGAHGIASGAGQLAAGTNALSSGAQELAGGTSALATQMPGLVDGAHQLAAGARATSEGTDELAAGIAQIAAEVPRYTDAEAKLFAELAMQPVSPDGDRGSLFSGTGAPLFLTVALWAGALAAFMLLAPLWNRTRQAALSEASITLRSSASGIMIGAIQGILAGALVSVLVSAGVTAAMSFVAFGALTGSSFALINQGLVALLRGPGRFISFVMLVAALVAGIVSTVPGIVATVIGATPLGSAMSGLQRIVETDTPGIGAVLIMGLWAGVGFFLIGWAVHRARRTLPEHSG